MSFTASSPAAQMHHPHQKFIPQDPPSSQITPEKETQVQAQHFKSSDQTTNNNNNSNPVITLLMENSESHKKMTTEQLPNLLSTVQNLTALLQTTLTHAKAAPVPNKKHLETLGSALNEGQEAKKKLQQSVQANRELSKQNKQLKLELSAQGQTHSQLLIDYEAANSRLKNSMERVNALETQRMEAEESIAVKEGRIKELDRQAALQKSAKDDADLEHLAQQEQTNQIINDLKAKLESKGALILEMAMQNNSSQSTIMKLKVQAEALEKEKIDLIETMSSKDKVLKGMTDRLGVAETDLEALASECESLRGLLGEGREKVVGLEKEVAYEQNTEAENRLTEMTTHYVNAKQQYESLKQNNNDVLKKNAEMVCSFSEKIATLTGENSMLTQRMNFAVQENEELRKEVEEGGRKGEELEKGTEKLALELERRNKQAALFELQHESLINQVEHLSSGNVDLKARLEVALEKCSVLSGENSAGGATVKGLEQKLRIEQEKNHNLTIELANSVDAGRKFGGEVDKAERELSELRGVNESLKSANNKYDGMLSCYKEKEDSFVFLEHKINNLEEGLREKDGDIRRLQESKKVLEENVNALNSEADMFTYKYKNMEEQMTTSRQREEEAREELKKLETRCEGLVDEVRRQKQRGEEGRSAFANMTRMMKEVEERSTEGTVEREKEIERLTQRCKVLGEAVGRLSGAGGKEKEKENCNNVEIVGADETVVVKQNLSDHEAWYTQIRQSSQPVVALPTTQPELYDFSDVPSPMPPVPTSPFPEKLRAKIQEGKKVKKKKKNAVRNSSKI
ncbi:hypothetical protein TL16_g08660 [Triparma laevis f. inornata]|uniref:Uncharacterized protein n=1 Tax=Triparma laevis f. inornata TaxID=1714386 RepID=A0A9W7B396_9STRA|nr:hypothetical protein TL16_g08660 [Triparma laevis f. inornata]